MAPSVAPKPAGTVALVVVFKSVCGSRATATATGAPMSGGPGDIRLSGSDREFPALTGRSDATGTSLVVAHDGGHLGVPVLITSQRATHYERVTCVGRGNSGHLGGHADRVPARGAQDWSALAGTPGGAVLGKASAAGSGHVRT